MKENKLYGTYEQFFASDSQTFLVKKYARVCIVSDEFLVRSAGTRVALLATWVLRCDVSAQICFISVLCH